jgi:hypothetical protein
MKVTQTQLRRLIQEALTEETNFDPLRIDQSIVDTVVGAPALDFGMETAQHVINDRSLRIIDKCLLMVGRELANAGVGGPSIPRLDRDAIVDILGEESINEMKVGLSEDIAAAIIEFVKKIAQETTMAIADVSGERN